MTEPCEPCVWEVEDAEETSVSDMDMKEDIRVWFKVDFGNGLEDAWPSLGVCPHHYGALQQVVRDFREGRYA